MATIAVTVPKCLDSFFPEDPLRFWFVVFQRRSLDEQMSVDRDLRKLMLHETELLVERRKAGQ